MRMNKKPLNLFVDAELVNQAKKHGINLSSFFELKLLEHLDYYYGKRSNKKEECGRRELNPSRRLGRP
jgi:hypothetical protein